MSVVALAEDTCRLVLSRAESGDCIRLEHDEFPELNSRFTFPSAPGGEREAALAALEAISTQGRLGEERVLRGGILSAGEVSEALHRGWQRYVAQRDAQQAEAVSEEESNPSRIIAVLRELGIGAHPLKRFHWTARCPGTNHGMMIATSSDQYGCGYCKVKGGPEELIAFVERRRVARASGP